MRNRTYRLPALVLAFSFLFSFVSFAPAADWPTFRADNRRSGSTDEQVAVPLSLQWTFEPAHAPKPAWPEPAEELPRMHCDNAHHVVVAKGVAYFGSSVDDRVYAIDAAAGEVLWTFFAEGPVRFAPTVSGGRVYFGSDDGYVYCLDAASGKLIWRHRPGPTSEKVIGNGRMISTWPVRTSVLVDGGQVLATAGVFPFEGLYVCALDAGDGSVIWKNETVGTRSHELPFGGISPHGYLVASESLLFVPSGRAMPAAFDRKTGRLAYYARAPGKRGGAWALLDDDRLIAGVDSSGRDDKRAYDARTGRLQGVAFSWVPGGIDVVVAADSSHILRPDGIHTIDRRLYKDTQKKIENTRTELAAAQARLSSLRLVAGCPQSIPAPDVHLSDLDALKATAGYREVKKDANIEGKAISMGGKKYEKGMGVHPFGELVYDLKDEYKAFVAIAGIDDQVFSTGSAIFQVFVDDKRVCETPVMRGGGGTWNVYVAIPAGSKKLRLVVTDAWDGISYDHTNWADAGFVTAGEPAQPPAGPGEALAAKIDSLAKRRDDALAGLEEAGGVVSVRRWRREGLVSIVRAGRTVFAGGQGFVLALDPKTEREQWKAEVDGQAVSLAVSDGRLFVSTDKGHIYCFGKQEVAEPRRIAQQTPEPPAADDTAGLYEAAAEKIVAETGITKGYCLIRDFGQGRLAVELAKRTDLQIIGLQKDAAKLAAARSRLEAAGLLGVRVAVEPWDASDLPEYFANLIVSDERLLALKRSELGAEYARLQRPCGGTAVFLSRQGEEIAIDKVVRGRLEGAGSWTSQYGDGGNTGCSGDTLLKGPLGVLWYGEPGPKGMVERHARAASGVSADGRLFVQGEEGVAAYDAYNGSFLWKIDIPGSARVRADVDGGNLALTDDALYVAARDKCYRLEPAGGQIVRAYTMPRSPDGSPRRWGYVSAEGKTLFGTSVMPLAAEYAQLLRTMIDAASGQWKDEQDVPHELRRWLRSLKASHPVPNTDLARAVQRGGDLWRRMTSYPSWRKQARPQGALTASLISADALFAIDAETGSVLWVHRGGPIATTCVAVEGGIVYFAETTGDPRRRAEAAESKRRLIERGVYEQAEDVDPADVDVRVISAAKAATGEILWRTCLDVTGCGGDKTGIAVKDGVLLLFGHFSNHDTGNFLGNQLRWRRITALSTDDGKVIWSKPLNYLRRPLVVGETVIIEPRACELRTGNIKTRPHPLTGRPVPWEFLRPGHSCGVTSASADTLFYRSFCTAILGLTDDRGLDLFGGIRPGCWVNIVPANGLMLMPEASSGCTCSYPIRCSVALVRKERRRINDGTVFITHGRQSPVKRLGINFGAAGDARDEKGQLWAAYPRPNSRSGVGYGYYGMALELDCDIAEGMGFFAREFRGAEPAGADRPWLFASGCKGLLRCEVPLIEDVLGERPGRYTVRLGFSAPEGDKAGQRVFDIKLQGRTVASRFDAVKEVVFPAGVVKEFKGVAVADSLVLEFVPEAKKLTEREAPLVNFIEIVREDAAAPQPPAVEISGDRAKKLLAAAEAEFEKKNFDEALRGYHAVFESSSQADLRLRALDRMTEIASLQSLACIKAAWDAVSAPILDAYEPADPRIVEGMARLRLAVAAKLSGSDRLQAAKVLAPCEHFLPRLKDKQLRRDLLGRLGYVLDWRLLGPIPWGQDQDSIGQVLRGGRPISPREPHGIADLPGEWLEHSADGVWVDLGGVLRTQECASAYAYVEITLDEPRQLVLNVKGSNAVRCWFNGRAVGDEADWQSTATKKLAVNARKGRNGLLLQIAVHSKGWGFLVRVMDGDGLPVPGGLGPDSK